MKNLLFVVSILFIGCNPQDNAGELLEETPLKDAINLISSIEAVNSDGTINAVIEIPTGSVEKWEVNKSTGLLEWEIENGKPRIIKFSGYPGNYGMIPRTVLTKEQGGDGDPLDILVLGDSLERGTVVKCKIIGALRLLDGGEHDDKLIGVSTNSKFYLMESIEDLDKSFEGTTLEIETFFTNYKEPNQVISNGYIEKEKALQVLQSARNSYLNTN
jgi:inorganic pyrophosphatase